MVLCAAYGCNSRSDRGEKISFHLFPKDLRLRNLWISKINRGETAVKKFKPTHHRLCGKHFEDDQFELSSTFATSIGYEEKIKKRLKCDAVPTIFVDQPEQCDRPSAARIQEKKLKNEMSERNKDMVKSLDIKADVSSTDLQDRRNQVGDSATASQNQLHVFLENSRIEEDCDELFGDLHNATNKTLANNDKSVDKLRSKLDSVVLIEGIQTQSYTYRNFDSLVTDTDGASCRGPCIDITNVYTQDQDGDTLLHVGIILLAKDLVSYFIDKTPCCTSLNVQNKLIQTPLHLAALTNQVSVVRKLVIAGADVESRDRDGNMAIHLACRENLLDVLKALLDPVTTDEQKSNNCDLSIRKIPQHINSKNYEGYSCLHIASSLGHMDIVKTLVDNEADVNTRAEKSGRTVLHEACWAGDINMVKYLLSVGKSCDINAKTYDGYTAFDIARSRGHWSIVLELATAGANYEDEEMEQ